MGFFRTVQQKFNEHKTTMPTIPKNPNGGDSASEAKTVVDEKTQQQYTVAPVVRHEFIPAPVHHEEEFNPGDMCFGSCCRNY